MARRTKEEAQETRNRLLDTAEQMFHEKGVSRCSLADIAEAAGLTRGAIYWHFEDKADLFDAMMERVFLPIEELTSCARGECRSDALTGMRRSVLTMLERLDRDPRFRRVWEICNFKVEYVGEMEPLRERQTTCRKECVAEFEAGFRAAAEAGQLDPTVDPRTAALGLYALVDGCVNALLLDPKRLSLVKHVAPLIDDYMERLKARGGAAVRAPAKPPRRAVKVKRTA